MTTEHSLNGSNQPAGWERDVVEKLAFAALEEQRRTRRWGIFFKGLIVVYILVLTVVTLPGVYEATSASEEHVALVDVRGIIIDKSEASAGVVIAGLRKAFENEYSKGVILRINSPGGSPVQADYIYNEILRLRKKYPKKQLIAVITDLGASGSYYIASAADKIYANKSSMLGSIGVVMSGFGYTDAMSFLGVERRLYIAGNSKSFLDPFSPTKDGDVDHIKTMLAAIHQQFIKSVKDGRGDRLKGDEKTIFSGLVWTGEQALELGLIDAFGSSGFVAREIFEVEDIIDYTAKSNLIERFAEKLGTVMADHFAKVSGLGPFSMR